jgi:hypothetical protein
MANIMNSLLLVGCCLLSSTCQAGSWQKSASHKFEGRWHGFGKQDDNSRWSIKIAISPNRYLIDYPSLKCGGALKLIKENADSLVFQEDLTYGLEGCYNKGKTVLIKLTNNTIRYYWYHENGGRKAAAGRLIRQVFSKKSSQTK